MKKIGLIVALIVGLASASYALDISEILVKNVGRGLHLQLVDNTATSGYIIEVVDGYVVLKKTHFTIYVKIADIVVAMVENDATRK
jgi:hypothetical protein